MTRTRLTSASGDGACWEKACPAARPPPSAITDLINSRRLIVGWGSKSHGHGRPHAAYCDWQESYTDEWQVTGRAASGMLSVDPGRHDAGLGRIRTEAPGLN